MVAVEEQLIQVDMKGSEGNLAFPNMLNEASNLQSNDRICGYGPTQPQAQVFEQLNTRLDDQLKNGRSKGEEVPKIVALIRQAELPAISVGEKP